MSDLITYLFPGLTDEQINTILNSIRLISYVLAVLLGFLVSRWDKLQENKKLMKNIQTMLKLEVRNNYIWLQFAKDKQSEEINFDYCAPYLSSKVYDAYLDKLGNLKFKELDDVYHSYYYLNISYALQNQIKELDSIVNKDEITEAKLIDLKRYFDKFVESTDVQFTALATKIYKGKKVKPGTDN